MQGDQREGRRGEPDQHVGAQPGRRAAASRSKPISAQSTAAPDEPQHDDRQRQGQPAEELVASIIATATPQPLRVPLPGLDRLLQPMQARLVVAPTQRSIIEAHVAATGVSPMSPSPQVTPVPPAAGPARARRGGAHLAEVERRLDPPVGSLAMISWLPSDARSRSAIPSDCRRPRRPVKLCFIAGSTSGPGDHSANACSELRWGRPAPAAPR